MSDVLKEVSSDLMKDFMKSHSGQLYVPSKMKKVLQQKRLGGVLKGGQVAKKDAVKAIEALQEAGMIHKYKTPSAVLKDAVKKYEIKSGHMGVQRQKLEGRRQKRKEEALKVISAGRNSEAMEKLMAEKQEAAAMANRRKRDRRAGGKQGLREKLEQERKKAALAKEKKDEEKKNERGVVDMNIDF